MVNTTRHAFLFSLMFHAIIVLVLFFTYKKEMQSIGVKLNERIAAHIEWIGKIQDLHPPTIKRNEKIAQNSSPPLEKQILKNVQLPAKYNLNPLPLTPKKLPYLPLPKSLTRHDVIKGSPNQLLEELHNAILDKRDYPKQAIELNETGSVTLSFKLLPSGQVRYIRILKSSGFKDLDDASIVSVRNIEPFEPAMKLLNQPMALKITLEFKL